MAQATLSPTHRTLGGFSRLLVTAGVAAALLTGALNVRPVFERAAGTEMTAPGPSAVDALAGISERAETPLDDRIASLQETLRDGAARTRGPASTELGLAYVQKARETGDPSYYPKAESLFQQALEAGGEDTGALTGLGTLALARHQFAEALDWGARAVEINPHHAASYGVIADAQIELGRYDEAVETVQTMVDLRPDLGSYSRVSYLRELMGDREGAIVAMEQAATAGSGYPENVAWVQVQLGNLHFDGGSLAEADRNYATALAAMPDYAPALAGQGRVAAANGDLESATALYARAVQRVPLPEFVVAYGDVLTAAGKDEEATTQYALVDAIQQIYAANGVDTDLELALFRADHGQPEGVPLAVEQARASVAARPSVVAWDILAWTLYRAGDLEGAVEASTNALRLGTRNALMHFHAGTIAAARGERDEAIRHLETALDINPNFSVRYAPEARATLERLRLDEVIL
jgi:tetratricopeptide (TPR) repeat protein